MKLIKSALLGTAAGLAIVSTASAADLGGAKKPTPVEYVRVCAAQGAGFFFIPGSTDTCLRVSGRVRAEYRYVEPSTRASNITGFRARGVINLDARTTTDFGLLRTFISLEANGNTGNYAGATGRANTTAMSLDKAFIQFAGITAGRASSWADYNTGMNSFIGLPAGGPDTGSTNMLAYSFAPGNGFVATIALEDPDRISNAIGNGTVLPVQAGVAYAGTSLPDVVANVRVDQAWGGASLFGAVHQLRTLSGVGVNTSAETDYGYAVGAAIKINLPFLAAGSQFNANAVYADGAPAYATGDNGSLGAGQVPAVTIADATLVGNPVAGFSLKNTKVWSVSAGILHFWTPTIRQNVFGSFTRVDQATILGRAADFDFIRVGTNLIWSPVRNLDIGAEVQYNHITRDARVFRADNSLRTIKSDGGWEARLRIQRDF
jgi:hypothetical protein